MNMCEYEYEYVWIWKLCCECAAGVKVADNALVEWSWSNWSDTWYTDPGPGHTHPSPHLKLSCSREIISSIINSLSKKINLPSKCSCLLTTDACKADFIFIFPFLHWKESFRHILWHNSFRNKFKQYRGTLLWRIIMFYFAGWLSQKVPLSKLVGDKNTNKNYFKICHSHINKQNNNNNNRSNIRKICFLPSWFFDKQQAFLFYRHFILLRITDFAG